jgi:PilX N-terminal
MKHSTPRHPQRGATTLAVTLMLLGAMLLVLLAANRNTLLELRQSANQMQSTAAFEAADAGLEWAAAMLNSSERLGPDCRPSALATETYRERHLDTSVPALTPRALQPACVHGPNGWSCACPGNAAADLGPATGPDAGAAFGLRLAPGTQPGVLRVTSTGCSHWAGDCRPGGGGRDPATARHEALFALQAALPSPPSAALTLRSAGVDTHDFFVSLFGLSAAFWKRQPAVHRLDCQGDCGAALTAAAARGITLVSVPGDLLLQGPLALGTAQRPMLIVADGSIRLQGSVVLHGVLYGNGLAWSAPAAVVRGALISEGPAAGDSSLDLALDTAVLDALRTRQGSFVRLPGSWRDF